MYPQKFWWFYFCNIIFWIKIFCITLVCVTNIWTIIFDSKETTHAEINVQNFVTQKMLCKISCRKKMRAKIHRQNYLTEVKSSRTSLASRTHFEVLGLGLEASSPQKFPCPRLEGQGPPPLGGKVPQLKFHQRRKCDKKAYCFFSFSFFLAIFADHSVTNQQYCISKTKGAGSPSIQFLPANLNV